MFDHVGIRVTDHAASRAFYETLLGALGRDVDRGQQFDEWNDFSIGASEPSRPVTRHLHVAFGATSQDEVDRVWEAGVAAGYTSDGEPGLRPIYSDTYYGAFLLDPDGNSVEAVYHGAPRAGDAVIDHLWIRVARLAASRAFYDAVAPVLGLELRGERPERFHVATADRSFALVHDGAPTENVHLAFPVGDDATVRAFHAAAVGAGFRDNGAPGERAYHPGYYAAFVIDPDGNTIEAVNHNGYPGG